MRYGKQSRRNALKIGAAAAAGERGTHMLCLTQALLDLGHADTVELIDDPHGQICQWSFPARGKLPPVMVRAYSGREMDKLFPRPKDLEPDRKLNYMRLIVTKGSNATVRSCNTMRKTSTSSTTKTRTVTCGETIGKASIRGYEGSHNERATVPRTWVRLPLKFVFQGSTIVLGSHA